MYNRSCAQDVWFDWVLDLFPSNKQTQGAEVEDLWDQGHFIKSQSVLGGSVSLSLIAC